MSMDPQADARRREVRCAPCPQRTYASWGVMRKTPLPTAAKTEYVPPKMYEQSGRNMNSLVSSHILEGSGLVFVEGGFGIELRRWKQKKRRRNGKVNMFYR